MKWWKQRGRTASLAVLVAGIAGVLVAGTGSGLAATDPVANGTRPASQPGALSTVTLVTGDRVTLYAKDGSKASVTPGEGRRGMTFSTHRADGKLYVIPRDAAALVQSGKVDRRLFDVLALTNAQRDGRLRLIVTYAKGKNGANTLRQAGADTERALPAIGGQAVSVGPGEATNFWHQITGPTTLSTGLEKVWLDAIKKPVLDQSVPQIGAPTAWAKGFTGKGVKVAVVDTGIDATHPDLAARVVAAKNFTAEEAKDLVGHGTHVASTIAGTAAASDGRYKGVAYEAQLLDAKVCELYGCPESAILDGMQWAVDQGAKVVNISLGGTDTPELDPLEEAVNTLTETTGTLFVIAAGNEGEFGAKTVGSPGSADAALTVGAVDKQDQLASFSSRGPRVGDGAVKPDITAPGVDIVAAKSKDSSIGTPVGDKYLSLSGTSMATPHVVGAAAILAQQHPDWKGPQVKAALMASAKPNPELAAFEQGAGRVDVAKAITQSVVSEPVSLSFGTQRWPHDDDQPVAKTLTYRNLGSAPVTLALAGTMTGPDGEPAPAGAFTMSANEVTVPAGGTADVTVTASTKHAGPDGFYSGSITATAGTASAITPFGVEKEIESYDVTINHIDRDGKADGSASDLVFGLSVDFWNFYFGNTATKVRLPKGDYLIESAIDTGEDEASTSSVLLRPTITVDKTTTLTFDAREAKPISIKAEKASAKPLLADIGYLILTENSGLDSSYLADSFDGIYTAHQGEALDPTSFTARVNLQLAEPGEDGAFRNSPYRYGLAWYQTGTYFTGFQKSVKDKQLATVKAAASQTLPGRQSSKVVFAYGPNGSGSWSAGLVSDLPSTVTELNQPQGVRWGGSFSEFVLDPDGFPNDVTALNAEPRTLKAGKRYKERWNAAAFSPAFPGEILAAGRAGDFLFTDVPLFSDQGGHAGYSLADSGYTKLFRNGQLVGETEYAGYVEVDNLPAGRGEFTLETHADRTKLAPFTTVEDVSWKFRSGHVAGEDFKPLPLWSVQYKPDVDAENYAKRKPIVVLPLTAQAQAGSAVGKLHKLRVEVSYDDGDTWHKAPLLPSGKNAWKAVLKPKNAKFVSLRATAEDRSGNELEQTLIRAYGIR
ncbi:S8 family serine peptidase [Tenggerimyces flavus]|uniref:S8 family serine peptidase n=1 Tax=Tenggerimyces flavus TaxID=1708749 RepID=A0ABV7YH54_9ACTN|nr:S8 family serine peptidase [Tenggerimyces flavus]MBM7786009.1 subtilisin family serine protease [Tenggerimyces flavus]